MGHVVVWAPQKGETAKQLSVFYQFNSFYLDMVKRLPRENSKENFLGLMTNIGKNEIARPKQIAPIIEKCFKN